MWLKQIHYQNCIKNVFSSFIYICDYILFIHLLFTLLLNKDPNGSFCLKSVYCSILSKMHTSNISKPHRLLTSAIWRLQVVFFAMFLCLCWCWQNFKILLYCSFRKVVQIFSHEEMLQRFSARIFDDWQTLQLVRQKLSQQNSYMINIPNILDGTNSTVFSQSTACWPEKWPTVARHCLHFFSSYFHFGRVWCELAKSESRDWWIPNCVLGRQQMLHHRC